MKKLLNLIASVITIFAVGYLVGSCDKVSTRTTMMIHRSGYLSGKSDCLMGESTYKTDSLLIRKILN